jgi:hypothetical protein
MGYNIDISLKMFQTKIIETRNQVNYVNYGNHQGLV